MTASEKYRPRFHLSPRSGWMNDPNGLILVDGTWHAFFQHDPGTTTHGPMHWGHATSNDLLNWTEQPVALYPTALGTCYSGSAVETIGGDVKLLYTAHGTTTEGKGHEVQCLVHANRSLTRFDLDPTNPVIANPALRDFRDPKVIWHHESGRWIMLVTHGQSIGFYGSPDLTNWSFLSSFGAEHGRHSNGPWECPDMVPLVAPNGDRYWILIVGLNPGGYAPGSGTQYFVGHFDGEHFHNANPAGTELWLDHGRDYYAAQTFFDRIGENPPTAIAWASNWLYARQTPTRSFRGAMSLPREMSLAGTADGLRVRMRVPASVRETLASAVPPGTGYFAFQPDLALGEAFHLTLFGEPTPQFIVQRIAADQLRVRTIRSAHAGMNQFAHDYTVDLPHASGPLEIEVFVDRGLVEISLADGLLWLTTLYFPDAPDPAPQADIG